MLVDETYAYDPTQYNMSTFMATYGFTAADVASGVYPFLAGRVFRQDKTVSAGTYGAVGMDWCVRPMVKTSVLPCDVCI